MLQLRSVPPISKSFQLQAHRHHSRFAASDRQRRVCRRTDQRGDIAGCGQCKRFRQGMYTLARPRKPEKGHRANSLRTVCQTPSITSIRWRGARIMSDAEATLSSPLPSCMGRVGEGGRREFRGDWSAIDRMSRWRSPKRSAQARDPDGNAQQKAGSSARNSAPTVSSISTTRTPSRLSSNSPAVSARTMLSNARATRRRSTRPFI